MRKVAALLLAVIVWLAPVVPLMPSAYAANGDQIPCSGTGVSILRCWKMIDVATAPNSGVWVPFDGMLSGTLHVSGISAGATLQIYASNDSTQPSNAADGQQVGSDITTNGFTPISGPYRWIKVKVSANGSGDSVSAFLVAANIGGGSGTSTGGTLSWSTTKDYDSGAGSSTQPTVGVVVPADGGPAAAGTDNQPFIVALPATSSSNNLCGGTTQFSLAASDSRANCKSSAGVVFTPTLMNLTTSIACYRLYATAGLPNVGTDTPKITIPIPPASTAGSTVGGIVPSLSGDGIYFTPGIAWAVTGTTTGLCSALGSNTFATGVIVNQPYK